MIEGVEVKQLKINHDDRGWLVEFLRADDPIFDNFGQAYLTMCKDGVVKAWHYHKKQSDYFVCVSGKALIVLYDLRKDSSTFGQIQEFTLADPTYEEGVILMKIPPMIAHGFTPFECDEARILNMPNIPYNREAPDENRIPWNDTTVPYKWPENVKGGG